MKNSTNFNHTSHSIKLLPYLRGKLQCCVFEEISEVVDALSDNTVDPKLGCSGCGLEWPDSTEVPEYKVLYRYNRQRCLRHWQCLRIRIAPYIFPSPHHATVCGCVEDMGPGER